MNRVDRAGACQNGLGDGFLGHPKCLALDCGRPIGHVDAVRIANALQRGVDQLAIRSWKGLESILRKPPILFELLKVAVTHEVEEGVLKDEV